MGISERQTGSGELKRQHRALPSGKSWDLVLTEPLPGVLRESQVWHGGVEAGRKK